MRGLWKCITRKFKCDSTISTLRDGGLEREKECLTAMKEREDRISQLTNELNNFKKQIDYSFIPIDWGIQEGDVLTSKAMLDGIQVFYDIRDLLNTTAYSRILADNVITIVGPKQSKESHDQYFNRLTLASANLVIKSIKYVTNKKQFNVSDRWNNGDTALVTLKGDCDLSVRCFVRILNDTLDKLKMFEYKKYVFQAVGFYRKLDKQYGHSWGVVYDPIAKSFRLVEATEDMVYKELKNIPGNYKAYFTLNFKNVWVQYNRWKQFI